ncbi:MAG: DUF1722 domain-containing protein [Candidatus Omnitrophota bacterium]
MKSGFLKPKIFASRCLGFYPCRWDGVTAPNLLIDKLKKHVDFVTVCPEQEIGLGIPRGPIRIVSSGNQLRLKQFNTKKDITRQMTKFAAAFLEELGEIDAFILKDRSPSCGIKNVKVYTNIESSAAISKTNGFFAREVIARYARIPVESEARLFNYKIREAFLTKTFTLADFRKIRKDCRIGDLVDFHSRNKFLLMSYSQKSLPILGRIVAVHTKTKMNQLFNQYEVYLKDALNRIPRGSNNINVITRCLGYFSKKISSDERKFILNSLEEYRRQHVPLSVPINILRSYSIRFKIKYLLRQTYLTPYPPDLAGLADCGKGRKIETIRRDEGR